MSLPNAGTAQAFEIAVQNANMALIEGGFTSDRTTLGTHTTQIGGILSNHTLSGTSANFVAATPAALNALAAGAAEGDTAYLVGDNASFYWARFIRLSGKWQQPFVSFVGGSATTALYDAFNTYLVLGTNTSIVISAGGTGIDTILGRPVEYATQIGHWRMVGGLVRPTIAGGSGVTTVVNNDGSATCTFTVGGFQVLSNVFPPKANYGTDNFDVEISSSGTTSTIIATLCTAGSSNGTNYDMSGISYPQSGAQSAVSSLAAVSWPLSIAVSGVAHEYTMELRHPGEALVTRGFMSARIVTTLGTNETGVRVDLGHRNAVACDGLLLQVSAACVVTVKVRPRT